MDAPARLDQYLKAFGTELKRVCIARGVAGAAAIALVVSVIGAYLAIRAGFASEVVITARLLLVVMLAAVIAWLVVLPIRRLQSDVAPEIEARTPAFAGRVETYLGMGLGLGERRNPNPLKELLAEDTLELARHFPVARQVKRRELAIPGAVAAVSLGVLLWIAIAGPGLLNYGVRHLWAGWAFPDLLPPQSIVVTPGDELVRRGGSLRVRAEMDGLDPTRASVHAKIGDGDWQEVDMARLDDGFEFTFFSLREPLNYFVSAAGIRSPAYEVDVVDLPNVESLRLTYHYPEWTHRPPETVEPGGDIRAIAGTEIELEVRTDMPLPGGELVLNGDSQSLELDGPSGRAGFEITADGQYFIAARVGGEQVRLTDDYFIKRLENRKPEVILARPGRDWSASNIEEVTTRVDAKDDYALESVELRYSVNGGAWQSVPLPFTGRAAVTDHVFFLERMGTEAGTALAGEAATALVPGDLISYYALATDRDETTRTDMFFIEVQPFDRRYTQSQMLGGGGGGQGQWQEEISQRQREIIVSTWNLLREQTESRDSDNSGIADNATLLSELQLTLADQAQTLARRTRARQLIRVDEQIASFVDHLEQAAEAMHPAAERLAEIDLEQAIQPEQEALQHLLRAEAAFSDVQVSFQRNPGSRGFRAGRDLAEMFELEMDLEKNQYETGDPASLDGPTQEFDDAMRELDELARRQQQLAHNLGRSQNLTPAQRWQQEMLRRETEELQQRLEQMLQQQAAMRHAEGQISGQASGQSDITRRMQSAIRAMNEAGTPTGDDFDRERLQRAADEAHRQLTGAHAQVAAASQRAMQQSFADMTEQATDLYEQQASIDEELQAAVRRTLEARREGRGRFNSGLTPEQRAELAQAKRDMREELQALERDMQAAAQQYRDHAVDAARELAEAATELRESNIESRLSVAAEYIENNSAAFIASSESAVTGGLGELRDRLRRAQSLAESAGQVGDTDFDRALAETRALREQLQRLAAGTAPEGRGYGEFCDGDVWNMPTQPAVIGPAIGPTILPRIELRADDTARAIRRLIPQLRARNLNPAEIDEVRELTRQLELARFDGNANLLARELNAALALLEQLELRLAQGVQADDPGTVRTAVAEPIPTEYKDAVAEYYRRLSQE